MELRFFSSEFARRVWFTVAKWLRRLGAVLFNVITGDVTMNHLRDCTKRKLLLLIRYFTKAIAIELFRA